jgi:hypothetical protein
MSNISSTPAHILTNPEALAALARNTIDTVIAMNEGVATRKDLKPIAKLLGNDVLGHALFGDETSPYTVELDDKLRIATVQHAAPQPPEADKPLPSSLAQPVAPRIAELVLGNHVEKVATPPLFEKNENGTIPVHSGDELMTALIPEVKTGVSDKDTTTKNTDTPDLPAPKVAPIDSEPHSAPTVSEEPRANTASGEEPITDDPKALDPERLAKEAKELERALKIITEIDPKNLTATGLMVRVLHNHNGALQEAYLKEPPVKYIINRILEMLPGKSANAIEVALYTYIRNGHVTATKKGRSISAIQLTNVNLMTCIARSHKKNIRGTEPSVIDYKLRATTATEADAKPEPAQQTQKPVPESATPSQRKPLPFRPKPTPAQPKPATPRQKPAPAQRKSISKNADTEKQTIVAHRALTDIEINGLESFLIREKIGKATRALVHALVRKQGIIAIDELLSCMNEGQVDDEKFSDQHALDARRRLVQLGIAQEQSSDPESSARVTAIEFTDGLYQGEILKKKPLQHTTTSPKKRKKRR